MNQKSLQILGLTGGIATGKSTFLAMLAPMIGARTFCSDARVKELLESGELAEQIRAAVHPSAYLPDGRPDRDILRNAVFSDEKKRRALEAILHPAVRATWLGQAEECRRDGIPFIADIPLLFETGAESAFDAVICLACSPSARDARLLARPGISADLAQKMIASQMPADTKMAKSDHVVWNDGSPEALEDQARILARLFSLSS